ncbi:MAG: YggS family pyridoxal phosphate-dependent enzyme [Oscillospiraceae bacterium]
MSISENIQTIRRSIAAVTDRRVLLVAATKMNDAPRVREAVAAGVDACGENKVQEFLEKDAQGAYEGCPRHFIGHLQRNKVNKIVGRVDLIQSVDSRELVTLIDKRARALGIVQDILIEISVAGEEQKSGIPPEELPALLAHAAGCPGVRVRGLMCVPPVQENPVENRPYFALMRQLFVDNGGKKYDNVFMDFLSMGMTDDYLAAVEEGANMVRIGSAIFGARNYAAPISAREEQH